MGFGSSQQSSNNQSQQTSESRNQAYPFLQSVLGGEVSNASKGSAALADILGLNGATGQNEGFQRFKDSSGYQFIQDEGTRSIVGNKAAAGALGSGSALKAIQDRGSNLASGFLNSYLSNLLGFSNQGLSAAQIISGAGNTANSQGTSYGTSRGNSTNFSLG